MKASEASEILRRAVEGGAFDELAVDFIDAPAASREETEVYWEIFRTARSILPEGVAIPPVSISAIGYQFVISEAHLLDNYKHSRFRSDFPRDLLLTDPDE